MVRLLTTIIAATVINAAIIPTTTQAGNSNQTKIVRYDNCGGVDGLNVGLSLGLAYVFSPRTRRCVDHGDGPLVTEQGENRCTVYIEDNRYRNKNCPQEVLDQLNK